MIWAQLDIAESTNHQPERGKKIRATTQVCIDLNVELSSVGQIQPIKVIRKMKKAEAKKTFLLISDLAEISGLPSNSLTFVVVFEG